MGSQNTDNSIVQQFVNGNNKDTLKLRITGLLREEPTMTIGRPLMKHQ